METKHNSRIAGYINKLPITRSDKDILLESDPNNFTFFNSSSFFNGLYICVELNEPKIYACQRANFLVVRVNPQSDSTYLFITRVIADYFNNSDA